MKAEIYHEFTGHQLLTDCYGKWPSFHDFEVLSVHCDRGQGIWASPTMVVKLHAFRLEVAEADSRRDNRVVTFRFSGVQELSLMNFNHQNAIVGLLIDKKYAPLLRREVYQVHFLPGFGMDCSFECDAIEVLSLEPFPEAEVRLREMQREAQRTEKEGGV